MKDSTYSRLLTVVPLVIFLLGSGISSTMSIMMQKTLAYDESYNQAEMQTDECGEEHTTLSVMCQNLGSETQGDHNAVNEIGVLTAPNRVGPIVELPSLNVFKRVVCPESFVCPVPSDFTIRVVGNNPSPSSFTGSAMGTTVSLKPGSYEVNEAVPDNPPGLIALNPVLSVGCSGDISEGQEMDCTITNEFIVAPPEVSTLSVVKQVICPQDFGCPAPSDFTIHVAGNNPDPSTFAGSALGTIIQIQPGVYEITETQPNIHDGLIAIPPVFSTGCTGNIQQGQQLSCVISNEFVVDRVSVGSSPQAIEYNPANDYVYVANTGANTVSIIDTNNVVVDTVTVGNNPQALKYNPANDNIYVANSGSDTVSIIDTNNVVVGTVPVGNNPFALEYNPDNDNIYVANAAGISGTVSVIDINNNIVVATLAVGNIPVALEYNPANDNIYVANHGSNFVSVIDTNNVIVDTVIVGHNPRALEYNPGNDNIYVADRSPDTVSIIDTNNVVIDTVPVGDTPQALKYNPANDNIYVANQGSGTVSVIDSNGVVVKTVSVGITPSSLEYNPANDNIYVANLGSGTVSIIDTNNMIMDTVTVGIGPIAPKYNPANDFIYIANSGSGTISVIPP